MVRELLENYLADLEYNYSNGLDALNHITNGTPYMNNSTEAEEYIKKVRKEIEKLEY